MRLIDADALGVGEANRDVFIVPEYADGWNSAIKMIKNAPTVDAVPVVRCKNCVHYSLHDAAGGRYCEILRNESPIESGYCCYGEGRNE